MAKILNTLHFSIALILAWPREVKDLGVGGTTAYLFSFHRWPGPGQHMAPVLVHGGRCVLNYTISLGPLFLRGSKL